MHKNRGNHHNAKDDGDDEDDDGGDGEDDDDDERNKEEKSYLICWNLINYIVIIKCISLWIYESVVYIL